MSSSNVFDHASQSEINVLTQSLLNFAVVFVADWKEVPVCLGSGTLARFDNIYGIVTCGHVADVIKNRSKIAVSIHSANSAKRYLNWVRLNSRDFLTLGNNFEQANGPDLAFIGLDHESFSILGAHGVAVDMISQGERAKRGARIAQFSGDFVVGAVEELNSKDGKNIEVAQQINAGTVRPEPSQHDFDYFRFESLDIEPLSSTHRGTSGGGWWRIDFERNENQQLVLAEKNFLGVAFKESGGQPNFILGHGPKSVHKTLAERVLDKFSR